MAISSRNQSGVDHLEGLGPFFEDARRERPLPEGLERAVLRDAASVQSKFRRVPERTSVIQRLAAAAAAGWRQAALLAASAVTGLAIGLSSASAVESIATGLDSGAETAGADIFTGLDELFAEE